jgi:hypothetical protein
LSEVPTDDGQILSFDRHVHLSGLDGIRDLFGVPALSGTILYSVIETRQEALAPIIGRAVHANRLALDFHHPTDLSDEARAIKSKLTHYREAHPRLLNVALIL